MSKLYFKYGAMGSSKTANALITKFNYEERGMKVWLIKPSIDVRDGADIVHVLFANGGAVERHDAENAGSGEEHTVKVGKVVLRLDNYGALGAADGEITVSGGAAAEGFAQHILKIAAIGALEHYLAVFT